jgi:hypothetical protein
VRIYYGRQDARGIPEVLVWRDGELHALPAEQHPRCHEAGHGWGEEAQALNTAWVVLRDALPAPWALVAELLAQRFRVGTVAKLPAKGWQFTREDVLRWVGERALEEAWPALQVEPQRGEEAGHVAPF